MAASVLTFFLNNPLQSGSSAGLLDLSQPAASTSTTGWTVGTASGGSTSRQTYNTEVPTTNFVPSSNVQPSGPPITTAGRLAEDCWRTSAATTGNFSAGTWYSSISIISVTAGASGTLRGRFRIWRSTDPGGASAVEITKDTMIGANVVNLLTTVAQSSSASTQVAAFSLANEYLFLQCAMNTFAASGSVNADALVRMGPITSNVAGSFLATSAFSATGGGGTAVSGAGFYVHRKHWGAA